MNTNPEQAVEALRKISDAEFESPLTAPWSKFPAELVRDELVRRLKLRKDLSWEAKKVKFNAIIERFRMISSPPLDLSWMDQDAVDQSSGEDVRHVLESSEARLKARIEEMTEHHRQLSDLYSQRDDSFEGKAKPGDWKPEGAEICPVCNGIGTGRDGRICGKCSGRGFISRCV